MLKMTGVSGPSSLKTTWCSEASPLHKLEAALAKSNKLVRDREACLLLPLVDYVYLVMGPHIHHHFIIDLSFHDQRLSDVLHADDVGLVRFLLLERRLSL